METEKDRLNMIACDSWYALGANAAMIRYQSRIFARYWRPGSCLELGPAEGLMTDDLVKHFDDITCVDGSDVFCKQLIKRYPQIKVINMLFEEFEPSQKFDNIILGHVLEHVIDPKGLLLRIYEWLAPQGQLFACVPNARSVHRQMAVIMGILETEHTLNESDRHHGHQRVFDPESFRNLFLSSGFEISCFGGFWLKPISNHQIDETWTPQMLEAAMRVGEHYPDIAAEIYVVAKLK